MAISNQGIVGTGPGFGTQAYRECHLEYADAADPLPSGPRTVSLWCKIDKPTNGPACALAVCTKGGPESLYLGTDPSGGMVELFVGGKTISSGYPLGFTWHHFGFRSDGVDHALYLDGSLVLQLVDPGASLAHPFDRLCLYSSTARAQLCGSLASVKVWSALLPLTSLMSEGRAMGNVINATGLYGFWPLIDPTDLVDHSGNGRDLVASSGFLAKVDQPPFSRTLTIAKPKPPQQNPSSYPFPAVPGRVPPPHDRPSA